MVNIKDVAERAGVSATTVSHVVNGTRFVAKDARARVEEAIAALGFVPSAVARSLKHRATRTFGMLLPNNSNPYFAEVLRGVEDRCFDSGYSLLLGNSDDDPKRQAWYLRTLAEKRIDGLILVSAGAGEVAPLRELKCPVVMLDRELPGLAVDLVAADHLLGGWLATRHLLDLAHPWVACISGPPGVAPSSQRRAGWKKGLAESRVERREGDLARGDFTPRGGYLAMQALLRRRPRPSAVFVCNDLMAFGALAAVREAGLKVPEDLSIVGYDDIQLAAFSAPTLTTVAQPKRQIGVLAAELLLDRLETGRVEPRRVLLEPELRRRESTAQHHPEERPTP
jgi:LacI family transcriptional regulator